MTPGGYVWWYLDGLSADGRHGITIIAFIGSVFSPYYFWAGRRDPRDHCALNVALYSPGGRWCMTERRRTSLDTGPRHLTIGPSGLTWDGDTLTVRIDETGAPVPLPLKGEVRLRPDALTRETFAIDGAGRHRWSPLAPRARVEVALSDPSLSWSGSGYFDTNIGDEPIADGFEYWTWSRADAEDGAAVLYDVIRKDGSTMDLALRFDGQGGVEPFASPARAALPRTPIWRVPRETRGDDPTRTTVRRTLEDTPFYSRSMVETSILGRPLLAMHESLCCERLDTHWVRTLLPFRMPRALW
ncbi:MAG: carotenoid 1,2-hydratase [Alphaproteobacteria bacterium]